jgi:hypothetical protein
MIFGRICSVHVVLFCATSALAQVRVDTGEIRGVVTDPSGSVIPGASVTARLADRGIARSALSGESGEYRFPLLPPGVYDVRVDAANFAGAAYTGVEVRVGETTPLTTSLSISGAHVEIDVSAAPPAIDPELTQQASIVDSHHVADLPINRRSYLDLALLTPGVTETSSIVGADYRLLTTPDSGLSFAGNNGRGNTFAIDGVENYSAVGGIRPSLPQAAVKEFQVNRSTYSAEFGGALGGAVNIVSRAGSENFHGSAFGYLRQRALQARNYFDGQKSSFTREQSGVTVEGPIEKSRTFFFSSVERLDRHEAVFVPILRDPGILSSLTASQQQLVSYFNRSGSPLLGGTAGLMQQLLTPSNNPAVRPLFARNSGVFPFSESSSQAAQRIDRKWNDRQYSFLRMNLTLDGSQNTRFGALEGLSEGSSRDVLDGTVMASHTILMGPRWLSVTRGAFGYSRLTILPNDPVGPEIDIAGFGTFGRNFFLPSDSRERHWEIQQSFSHDAGKHNLRFGAAYNPTVSVFRVESYFGGRVIFAQFLPLAALLNTVTGNPNYAASVGAALGAQGQGALGANLGDPISALQAYSVGIPVAYIQTFGNPYLTGWQRRSSAYIEDGYHPSPHLTVNVGARLESESDQTLGRLTNIAPRLGFAWSTPGAKTLVRGGYGLYYSKIDIQMLASAYFLGTPSQNVVVVPIGGVPGVTNPQTGQPVTSADIYGTLLRQGILGNRVVTRQDLAQFGLGPNFRFPLSGGVDAKYERPWAHQASLELEHSFGSTAVSAAVNFTRGAHLPLVTDRAIGQTGTRPDGSPILAPVDPKLMSNYVWQSGASSFYTALILQISRRLSRGIAFDAHYTLSRATDEVTDATQDYMPSDPLNRRLDRGLSSFRQKHHFVATALLESPYRTRRGQSLARNVAADFKLSMIGMVHSGQPFNVLTGYDTLGDGQNNTHRPWGLGRNAGLGPGYASLDARLARAVPLGRDGASYIRFTAEAFNLLNQTNFEGINNIVGGIPLQALPELVGKRGDPTAPFSFTSAYAPRQFQLGITLGF